MGKQDWIWDLPSVEIYKMILNNSLNKFPNGYWTSEDSKKHAKECTLFLIEDILKWDDSEIRAHFKLDLLKKYHLGGMAKQVFNKSPFLVIDNAFPNRYQPWELGSVPKSYWNEETGIMSVLWMIERSRLPVSQITRVTFQEYGLINMLNIVFNGSSSKALMKTLKNEKPLMPWEFKTVPSNFWDKETGVAAVKWLVEEKLCLNDEDLKKALSQKMFFDNGLRGALNIVFNGSPYEAISAAYGEKFKPWEFNQVPLNYWNPNTVKEAIYWLIEDKLKWSHNEITQNLSKKIFFDNGLGSMLEKYFNGSPYEALNFAYPDCYHPKEMKNKPRRLKTKTSYF